MKVVLVTGSRHFQHQQTISTALHAANPDIVIHGAARGADTLASRWCHLNPEVYEIAVPAKWNIHGKPAGIHRNKAMIRLHPDRVLAFLHPEHENKGTLSMIDMARNFGIPVTIWTQA